MDKKIVSKKKAKGQKKKSNQVGKASGVPRVGKVFSNFLSVSFLMKIVSEVIRSRPLKDQHLPVTKRDVPYWDALFHKGTQIPPIRFGIQSQAVNLASSAPTAQVFTLDASILTVFPAIAGLFGEYRFVAAEWEYVPVPYQQISGSPIASISGSVIANTYDNNNAFGSFDEAYATDGKKLFSYSCIPQNGHLVGVRLPVQLEPITAQQWIDTATLTVPVAFCKTYVTGGLANNTNGLVTGWCDIQFRQLVD